MKLLIPPPGAVCFTTLPASSYSMRVVKAPGTGLRSIWVVVTGRSRSSYVVSARAPFGSVTVST